MKQRPILFSAPMVRAILEGRKTQTRRVLKHQPIRCTEIPCLLFPQSKDEAICQTGYIWPNAKEQILAQCPYGQPGDRLWIREAWRACRDLNSSKPSDIEPGSSIEYEATARSYAEIGLVGKLRPGMFMPRWASRIMLEVVSIRVEQLQGISEADAISEGIQRVEEGWARYHCDPDAQIGQPFTRNPILAYRGLWESINGPGSWDANPWVWVVGFKRLEGGAA